MLELAGPVLVLTATDCAALVAGRGHEAIAAAIRRLAAEADWHAELEPAATVAAALGISETALRHRLRRGTWPGQLVGARWFAVPPSSELAPIIETMTTHQRVALDPAWLSTEIVQQIATAAGKAGAEASGQVAAGALHDATTRLEALAVHRRAVPDTTTLDIPGLAFGTFKMPAASWPLVDELGTLWGSGRPLIWLAEVPNVEIQNLEKAPLGGSTIKVAASASTPVDHAIYTDVALQTTRTPGVADDIVSIMSASLAADVDRHVADQLATKAGTAVADAGAALAALAAWPGPRILVLGAAGLDGIVDLVALADMSRGAISVIVDPYIDHNLAIARVGVAVGVLGFDALAANRPAHLGIDRTVFAASAVEAATGAVATWPTTP